MLEGIDASLFEPTIDRFHDLTLRYQQFENALANAAAERREEAAEAIAACQRYIYLVNRYDQLITSGDLKLRIMHNDTKINNILFDATTRNDVCVIDLDTLMPGYFIYDLGDMIRTFVSPVDEEEKDLSKIEVRQNIYEALVKGYLSEMGGILDDKEKLSIEFSGQMMTYIMALRMLADFLNGDVYYHTTYPRQNLIRACNQLRLLDLLTKV
jgi:Ser/Thr protein kinase RdoA (MazF antagonist)